MEWYEDPVRARDEVKRAAWRGALRLLMVQCLLFFLAAILFPLFAQAHSYSGPVPFPDSVARSIQSAHDKTGRWPTAFEEIRPLIGRRDAYREFRIAFLPLRTSPTSAEYVVGVNGNLGRYSLGKDATRRVGTAVQGLLPAIQR